MTKKRRKDSKLRSQNIKNKAEENGAGRKKRRRKRQKELVENNLI